MNKRDMMNLIDHLITQSRFWHLEYARANVVPSEYEKIKSYRDTFDKSLHEKGEDIINNIERESDVEEITLFLNNYTIILDTKYFTHHQLRNILDDIEGKKDINEQSSLCKLSIKKDNIIGFRVKYKSEYKKNYHKGDK